MQNTLSTILVTNSSTVHPVGGQLVNRVDPKRNLLLSRLEGQPYSRFDENGWVYDQDPRSPGQRGRDRPGNGDSDAHSHYSTCTQEGEARSSQSEVSSHPGSGQTSAAETRGAIQQPRGAAGGAVSTTGAPNDARLGLRPALSSFTPDTGEHRPPQRADEDPLNPPDFDPSQVRSFKKDDSRDRD